MKKASLKDIATIAGVSIATVSYALNNSPQVSEVTRAKIKKIADELNYVPNLSAQNLKTNRSNLVCAIVNTYQGNFNGEVLQEIQNILEQKGYQLLSFSGVIPDIVKTDIIDGVIILNYRPKSEAMFKEFADGLQKPVVFMTSEVHSEYGASVVIDNPLGIRYLFDALVGTKHQKICFITGDDASFNNQERYSAAKKYYQKYYKKDDFEKHTYTANFDSVAAYHYGKKVLLEKKYDCFFCFSDDMALGIYHAANDLHLRVGEDLSIVGFDDSYVSSLVSPGLTTVHVEKKEWAEAVVEQYLNIKDKKQNHKLVKIPPRLALRDSIASH